MVKYFQHIALFLSLMLVVGCNPGLVDNPPMSIASVKDYFWDSEKSGSLHYEYFRFSDSSHRQVEYAFSRLSGINTPITVNDQSTPSKGAFYYKFDSSGSVIAGGLSYHSLFPLPDGYEILGASSEKTLDTTIYGTKKVLALNNNFVIAIRSDDSVFHSINNGVSWEKSFYNFDFGTITSWTRVAEGNTPIIVYAGTSNGSCVVSKDGGKTWMLIMNVVKIPITSIAAVSSGVVILSTGSKEVHRFDINTKLPSKEVYPSTVTSLSACEVYNDAGTTYPVFIIGTKDKGLYYWIQGKSVLISNAKGATSIRNIVSIAPTGRSFAVALGYDDASTLTFLYSIDAGLTWDVADVPFKTAMYLDAVPSVSLADILIADHEGDVHLGSSQQGIRPTFKSDNLSNPGVRINDISISGSVIVAAIDAIGVMVSTDKGGTWEVVSNGLQTIRTKERKIDGSITLLPTRSEGLQKGDEWLAGNLSAIGMGATVVIELNAKVVEPYISLDLPFSAGSYSDVFEVVYSCTPNGRDKHSVHVFYAKGVGPILFQRYIGDKLIDQSYLKSK